MSTKKVKDVVVPVLSTAKKSSHVPKLSVTGLEKLAAKLRTRAQEIENLKVEQQLEENTMLDVVKKERVAAEKKGQFYKLCLVEGEGGNPVSVQFTNRFSKINSENEPVLRECLGELFDELYVPQVTVKLRNTVSPETLKEKIGEELYMSLFEEEKWVAHRDEFMENRSKLRMRLDDKTNNVVDQLVAQTQSKPSCSYK